jgi:hypothetical protein
MVLASGFRANATRILRESFIRANTPFSTFLKGATEKSTLRLVQLSFRHIDISHLEVIHAQHVPAWVKMAAKLEYR